MSGHVAWLASFFEKNHLSDPGLCFFKQQYTCCNGEKCWWLWWRLFPWKSLKPHHGNTGQRLFGMLISAVVAISFKFLQAINAMPTIRRCTFVVLLGLIDLAVATVSWLCFPQPRICFLAVSCCWKRNKLTLFSISEVSATWSIPTILVYMCLLSLVPKLSITTRLTAWLMPIPWKCDTACVYTELQDKAFEIWWGATGLICAISRGPIFVMCTKRGRSQRKAMNELLKNNFLQDSRNTYSFFNLNFVPHENLAQGNPCPPLDQDFYREITWLFPCAMHQHIDWHSSRSAPRNMRKEQPPRSHMAYTWPNLNWTAPGTNEDRQTCE